MNCSDTAGCGVFLLKKNRSIPTPISITAAVPIAIPAIAPPLSFVALDVTAANVEDCAAADVVDVVDVVADEVEEEDGVADDEGGGCVVLLRPPGL